MPIRLEQELYRAALLTFEELTLMLPVDVLDAGQRAAKPSARANISFAGPFGGTLVVTVYGNLLPVISANMLGQNEPPPESEQLDALREIANVVCGNLLPALAGSEAIFRLSPPVVVNPLGAARNGNAAAEVEVGLEEGRFHFSLALSGKYPMDQESMA